jgi:hypothetical protein
VSIYERIGLQCGTPEIADVRVQILAENFIHKTCPGRRASVTPASASRSAAFGLKARSPPKLAGETVLGGIVFAWGAQPFYRATPSADQGRLRFLQALRLNAELARRAAHSLPQFARCWL